MIKFAFGVATGIYIFKKATEPKYSQKIIRFCDRRIANIQARQDARHASRKTS